MQNACPVTTQPMHASDDESDASNERSSVSVASAPKRGRDDNEQLFVRLTNDNAVPLECFKLEGDARKERVAKQSKKLSPQEIGNLLVTLALENQRLRAINAAHELRALLQGPGELARFTMLLPCFPLGQAGDLLPELSMLHNFGIFRENGVPSYSSVGRTSHPIVNHRNKLTLTVGLFAFHPDFSKRLQGWFEDCQGAGDVLREAAARSARPAESLGNALSPADDQRAAGVVYGQRESYLHYLRALEKEPELVKALRPVKADHFMRSAAMTPASDASDASDAPDVSAGSDAAPPTEAGSEASDDGLERPGLKLQLFARCSNAGQLMSAKLDGRPLFSWTRVGHVARQGGTKATLANNEVYLSADSWQVKMEFRLERPLRTRKQAYELVVRPAAVEHRQEAMYLRLGPFELRNGISNRADPDDDPDDDYND